MKRAHVVKVESCHEHAYPGTGDNAFKATDSAGRSFIARTEDDAREMAEDYNQSGTARRHREDGARGE